MSEYGLKQCPIYKEAGDYYETSAYGERIHPITKARTFHSGSDGVRLVQGGAHDIATIVAIEDGEVTAFDKSVKGYDTTKANGCYVRLKHSSGRVSWYLHLAYNSIPDYIKNGAKIKKGQTLGTMGATGQATGAHIHFQVQDVDGSIIDPKPYIIGKNINLIEEDSMYIAVSECKYPEKSEAVKNLQKKLCQISPELETEVKGHSVGKDGQFDGVFGRGMEQTLKKIQAAAGIEPTGECDAQTCELLNSSIIELAAKINTIRDIID